MEILPVPHRPPPRERRRFVLGLLLLAPVVLLVLLPAVLGLDRYLVTDNSMGDSMGRGSVVLARNVPAGDLRVGDVISFTPQGQHTRVTHRIVSIKDGRVTTRGDSSPAADPSPLNLDQPTYARVLLHVPWIGYPFVLDGGWMILVAVASLALGTAAVTTGRHQNRYRRTLEQEAASSRPRMPVG